MKNFYNTYELFKFVITLFTTICIRYIKSSKESLCLYKTKNEEKTQELEEKENNISTSIQIDVDIETKNHCVYNPYYLPPNYNHPKYSNVGYDLDNENDNETHIVNFNWKLNNSL